MRVYLAILLSALLAFPSFGQDPDDQYLRKKKERGIHAVVSFQPGWTWLHDDFSGDNAMNSGSPGGCSAGTTCTIAFNSDTTSSTRSVWAIGLVTTNNVTISTVCTGNSCSGTNDNWNLCGSSACHAAPTGGTLNLDLVYNVNGTLSSSSFSVTLSGASGAVFILLFFELLPPRGFTPAFDAQAITSSASCTTCTMAAPSIGGTDVVLHLPNGTGSVSSSWTAASSPYIQDFQGNVFGFNITSATAPTYTQTSGGFIDTAISFKTTSSFTPSAAPFSMKNMSIAGFNGITCNSTTGCTMNIVSTSAGDLLFLAADGSGHVTSATASTDTFTFPSVCKGANPGSSTATLSCGYVLSSTSGETSLTLKTDADGASIGVIVFEVSRSSGAFSHDYENSESIAAGGSAQPPGVGPVITGPDVCFQSIKAFGGANAISYYPLGPNNINGGNGPMPEGGYGAVALLNTANNTAPKWGATNTSQGFFGYVECFR